MAREPAIHYCECGREATHHIGVRFGTGDMSQRKTNGRIWKMHLCDSCLVEFNEIEGREIGDRKVPTARQMKYPGNSVNVFSG